MAEAKSKSEPSEPARKPAPTNYQDQVASQETSVRDAKFPEEKTGESTIAQVEEIKSE